MSPWPYVTLLTLIAVTGPAVEGACRVWARVRRWWR